jgi:hypothetical protein
MPGAIVFANGTHPEGVNSQIVVSRSHPRTSQVKLGRPHRLFLCGSTWQLGNPDVTFNTGLLANQDEQAGRTIHIEPSPGRGTESAAFFLRCSRGRAVLLPEFSAAFWLILVAFTRRGMWRGLRNKEGPGSAGPWEWDDGCGASA